MSKLIILITTLFILSGCSNNSNINSVDIDHTLPTRSYFAISEFTDEHGWQSFVMITINEDDVVTDISLDGLSWTANITRSDMAQFSAYEEHFGYNFYDQTNVLSNRLIGSSRLELVDLIYHANTEDWVDFESTIFAELAEVALESTPVSRGLYLDGAYRAFGDFDEDGYQQFVSLFIINGDIVAAHFNAVNNSGTLKFNHVAGEIVSTYAIGIREQLEYFEQILIEVQDPMTITFDVDGFALDFPQLHIPVEPLVGLVIQALGAGPVVE